MTVPSPPPNEMRRLDALRRLGILDTPEDPDYDRIAQLASSILDAPIALVSLIDSERQWFKAKVGLDIAEMDRNMSICTHVIDEPSDGPLVINDVHTDPRFAGHPLVAAGSDIHAYLGQGLRAPGGELVGTLCVVDRRPRDWNERDQLAIADIAVFAEQLLARTELDEIAQALQRSEDREAVMLATMHDGLIVQDPDGRITQWNPAAERVLGLTGDELSGRTSTDPRWGAIRADGTRWSGDTHPAMEALRTGRPVREEVMGVERPDNTFVWLRVSSTPTTERGIVTGVVTSFTDITTTLPTRPTPPPEQPELQAILATVKPHVQHFIDTMNSVRATLESESATAQHLLDALDEGADFIALMGGIPMSEERDRLTVAISQLEEARRLARAHLFDALHRHGVSIGEIARMWGISRQLASRIIRDLGITNSESRPEPPS